MSRGSYVLRRLGYLVPTAIGVTIVVFFLVHLIPGDPAAVMLGPRATPALIHQLDENLGLNRSLPSQYWLFLDHLFHGDLGTSLFLHAPVTTLIGERIGPTLLLLLAGTVITIAVTVPLAALAATRRGKLADYLVRGVPLIGLAMPAFWIGIVLIILLAVKVQAFPVAGYGIGVVGHIESLILPGVTIAMGIAPLTIRSLRTSMIEALDSDYVAAARAKHISEFRVVFRHALRNALPPAVTVLGVNIGWLVGGTVVVEQVFAIPGLGTLMVSAIYNKDFPVVQGVTLVFAALVVLVNLATDVAHMSLDPRATFR